MESWEYPVVMRVMLNDAIFLGSVAALAYGCWLAWPPLGWIVPASVLAYVTYLRGGRK